MTYREVLEYLDARPPRGERRGLERMRLLMHKLGDPQRSLRFVHIAGTSGKGSTAAMTERMLRACGYRTGLFVSPHTFDFRERIQLDGVMADKALLAETLTEMRPALDALDAMGDPAAAFETMTALALCVFARKKPDLVVLEVGIGGLLDSTNIIDPPEVAAVCAISVEHTNLLGKTIPEIAAQKCGIIKPGCRAVGYCALPPEALAVFQETCRRCGVTPEIPVFSQVQLRSETDQGSRFVWQGREWFVPLAGLHQVKNALTALAILHQLQAAGYDLPEDRMAEGLSQCVFPGRLQVVRRDPTCLLDGAHNPGKLEAMCQALDRLYPQRPLIAVMGIMARKDHQTGVPMVARRCRAFVAVDAEPGSGLALPPEQLAREAAPFCPQVRICPDAKAGAQAALALAGPEDVIVACGSIYLLESAMEGFLEKGPAKEAK